MKRLFLRLQCAVALMLAGCAGYSTYYDPYYYDYAYYDPYYSYYDSYYAYSYVDPVYDSYYYLYAVTPGAPAAAADLNGAAAAIAAKAATYYTPAGCATATASGTTVTTTFNNCTGLAGTTSGTTTLNLAQVQNQVAFTSTSQDLSINGEPFNLDLQGTIVSTGTQRVVTLVSKSFSPQRLDSRQAQSTLTWDQGSNCLGINGSSTSTRGGLSSSATLTDFRRCVGQCPSAGTLSVQGPNDNTFSATFDGSNRVQVSAPDGTTKGYDLTCG